MGRPSRYSPEVRERSVRLVLEHEREHTGQVVEILRQRRGVLLAELAAARRELLAALAALPSDPPVPVCGEWTARDVLGHVADWEWVGVEGLRLLAQAKSPLVELVTDVDAWNREHVAARRDQVWETVLEDLHAARQALAGVSDTMRTRSLRLMAICSAGFNCLLSRRWRRFSTTAAISATSRITEASSKG